MDRISRKIISGVILCSCVLLAVCGASYISDGSETESLPVSLSNMEEAVPIVVLDAGHKERVLSIVIWIRCICL